MSVEAIASPGRVTGPRMRLRLEHIVMGGAILCLIVLVVLPLLSLLLGSIRGGERGMSLDNFAEVLSGRLYVNALKNSLILGAWTGLFSLIIGVSLAWAVSRTDVPGKALIQLTASLSYLSPPFLTAIAFVYLFSPNAGLINVLVRDMLGLPFLTFNIFSMTGLVLVTVLHTFPFVYLLASSALLSVDASYEEAAQILGASKLRTALTVTAPLVAPAILSGTLLAFVNAIALFGSQAIIGLPGRIVTLPTRIYALFDYPPEYGLASALSLLFVVITVVALYLQRAFLARRSLSPWRERSTAAVDVAWPGALGGARVRGAHLHRRDPVALFDLDRSVVLEVLGTGFLEGPDARELQVHPVRVQRHPARDPEQPRPGDRRRHDRGAARRHHRLDRSAHPHPRPQTLDFFALIPLGLPGIVVAVALIQFWLAMPLALYGTLAILLLAYVGRYIPLGVRAANSSLRQIDPSLEESAQILGASWLTTMREVTLPLIRPGLFAGWLLVFVPVIQELSASILLFSSSSITLAVAVYNLYETGYIEPVAALAIINMLIIGAAIFVANKLGGGKIASRSGATQGLAS